MAIKKNDMDASLYKLCDELRGGMDPSQYKDYVLTLVFVKYVSDKFKGRKYAPIVLPEGCSFDDFKNFRNKPRIFATNKTSARRSTSPLPRLPERTRS